MLCKTIKVLSPQLIKVSTNSFSRKDQTWTVLLTITDNCCYKVRCVDYDTQLDLTPPSVADVAEAGDDNDVGVVQALPILSSELVDEDFDSSLRLSFDPRLAASSFSTCLCK